MSVKEVEKIEELKKVEKDSIGLYIILRRNDKILKTKSTEDFIKLLKESDDVIAVGKGYLKVETIGNEDVFSSTEKLDRILAFAEALKGYVEMKRGNLSKYDSGIDFLWGIYIEGDGINEQIYHDPIFVDNYHHFLERSKKQKLFL